MKIVAGLFLFIFAESVGVGLWNIRGVRLK